MGEPIAVSAEQLGTQLTERDSSFARRDVVQALAEHARCGADIPAIERAADRFLTSDAVTQLGEDVFSTPAHLEMERRVLDGATSRRDEQTAIVPESIVAEALVKSTGSPTNNRPWSAGSPPPGTVSTSLSATPAPARPPPSPPLIARGARLGIT
jgi:hypothetical protein